MGATIGITQSIAMGGQLSMPNVPDNFFGFAIAFAWANLNFGVARWLFVSSDEADILRSLAAEENDDVDFSGLYRYAAALGMEPRLLFVDVLLSYCVCLFFIAVGITLARAVCEKCIAMHEDATDNVERSRIFSYGMRKLTKARCQRILDAASIRRTIVIFTYFASYQLYVGVFFQLRLIFGGTVLIESADGLTSFMGAVAIIMFFASASILGYASWLYFKHAESLSRESNLDNVVSAKSYSGMLIKDLTTAFDKKFKAEHKMFWMVDTLKRILTAAFVATLTPYPGAQTALVLVIYVAFCTALLVLRPFKPKASPILRTTVAHAYAFNGIFYVIFACGSSISESALVALAKVQIGVGMIAYICLFVLAFKKVSDTLRLHERISWRPPSTRFVSFNSWAKKAGDGSDNDNGVAAKTTPKKTDSCELVMIANNPAAAPPPAERILSVELKAYSSSKALAAPKNKRDKKKKSLLV